MSIVTKFLMLVKSGRAKGLLEDLACVLKPNSDHHQDREEHDEAVGDEQDLQQDAKPRSASLAIAAGLRAS